MRTKGKYEQFLERMRDTEPQTENLEQLWGSISEKMQQQSPSAETTEGLHFREGLPENRQSASRAATERLSGRNIPSIVRKSLAPVIAASAALLFFGIVSLQHLRSEDTAEISVIVSPDNVPVHHISEKVEIHQDIGNNYYKPDKCASDNHLQNH